MAHEDKEVVDALSELCRGLSVSCLIQVGAGDGYEAECVRLATGCRAIAIEGDTRHPKHYNIEYHNTLMGATDGITTYYLHATPDLSSQLQRSDGGEVSAQLMQRRLDTFCDENGVTPDALIIDTEGTTLDVLEGAGKYIDGIKVVYAECQVGVWQAGMHTVDEIDGFLQSRGMKLRPGLPSYDAGSQGNYTWVRDDS